MTKEDLNRQFGRQTPINPMDLLAAAHLIREHCNSDELCMKCIFHDDKVYGCVLFEESPRDWELSVAEHRTADWIDKQYFQGRGLYTDTDTKEADDDAQH